MASPSCLWHFASLLAVNKDLLNRELHTPEKLELLKQFATDKGQRALVGAKVEKPATDTSVNGVDTSGSATQDATGSDSTSMRRAVRSSSNSACCVVVSSVNARGTS